MKEKDLLGEVDIPDNVFYGINTVRAVENFRISGLRPDRDLIESLLLIKKCSAYANYMLKNLEEDKYMAIVNSIDYIIKNFNMDYFPLDPYQAGAGTSTNMNVNEVISKVSLKIFNMKIDPNDDVNRSQSSNDVYPSAVRLAIIKKYDNLKKSIESLIESFEKKIEEYGNVVKVGRTHLMDAAPISFGQEFSGYVNSLKSDLKRIENSLEFISRLNIGGTAVGTGLNKPEGFEDIVIECLKNSTGRNLRKAENLFEVMQSLSDFSYFSSSLRILAEDTIKISNDIRFMSSGPSAGINEIKIPAVQQGSSIMPGKINPSIAEAVIMSCLRVISNDYLVSQANQMGNLEINVFTPVVSYSILESMNILTNALNIFDEKLVKFMIVNEKRVEELLKNSQINAVAFSPYIGYKNVAELVRESYEKNKRVEEIIVEKGLLKKEEVEKILQDFYKKILKH